MLIGRILKNRNCLHQKLLASAEEREGTEVHPSVEKEQNAPRLFPAGSIAARPSYLARHLGCCHSSARGDLSCSVRPRAPSLLAPAISPRPVGCRRRSARGDSPRLARGAAAPAESAIWRRRCWSLGVAAPRLHAREPLRPCRLRPCRQPHTHSGWRCGGELRIESSPQDKGEKTGMDKISGGREKRSWSCGLEFHTAFVHV